MEEERDSKGARYDATTPGLTFLNWCAALIVVALFVTLAFLFMFGIGSQ